MKKENRDLICKKNFLKEELTQLRNEINIERCNFLNQINVYIEANGELEKKFKLFDIVKKRNEKMKK